MTNRTALDGGWNGYEPIDEGPAPAPECWRCGGETYPLGYLGPEHAWFRCRNCGSDVPSF